MWWWIAVPSQQTWYYLWVICRIHRCKVYQRVGKYLVKYETLEISSHESWYPPMHWTSTDVFMYPSFLHKLWHPCCSPVKNFTRISILKQYCSKKYWPCMNLCFFPTNTFFLGLEWFPTIKSRFQSRYRNHSNPARKIHGKGFKKLEEKKETMKKASQHKNIYLSLIILKFLSMLDHFGPFSNFDIFCNLGVSKAGSFLTILAYSKIGTILHGLFCEHIGWPIWQLRRYINNLVDFDILSFWPF